MDNATLGAEALQTGHTDLGVRGLELLTGETSTTEGQAVLEQVMLSRQDDLAIEAAKLLLAQRGTVAVAGRALEAAYELLQAQAITWLAAEYDQNEAAKDQLRRALESRYPKVRSAAAFELATKRDPAAFDALVKLLAHAQEPNRQRRVIEALVTLGDPRTPDAFLDRLENDPSGTALASDLFAATGSFRRPENAHRLLALLEKNDKWRQAAFAAVHTISGYDQHIADPDEESPEQRWQEKQFPRHDAILACLLDRCFSLAEPRLLRPLLTGARWARGKEVEPILTLLAAHPEEDIRRQAVEAISWRLRKRRGFADALLKALQHRDAITQFLAAEGLAKAGRAEGLNVLLASVDFLSDVALRQRAVQALGELADARALDTLLRLANEDGHALQEEAAEAIGHLGRSTKVEEIFQLLERFAKGNDGVAENALKGLRWLNTHAGWQLIRRRAADRAFSFRATAVELLGYNNDPATRDLLLRLLAKDEEGGDVIEAALASARRLWGKDSLEPDYALLQNQECFDEYNSDDQEVLRRVCERGEPRRIMEILSHSHPSTQTSLATSLLNRPTLPLAEAQAAISSSDERTVQLAAQILGRVGKEAFQSGAALQTALPKWRNLWEERRQKLPQADEPDEHLANKLTPCLQSLLWAAGRLGVAQDAVIAATAARPGDPCYRAVRLAAVSALASGEMTAPVIAALEVAAFGDDPEVRALAAEAVGRQSPAQAAALAERMLSDRVSFNRLTAGDGTRVAGTLCKAVSQVHYQGVALPHLIAAGDVEGLAAVAGNRQLPEATRLGAIEGLAKLGREAAEAKLLGIGQSKEEDEELRKAAWRGLRRSKRARQRVQSSRAEVNA
jgi:ParB family chromosome partitioning protein